MTSPATDEMIAEIEARFSRYKRRVPGEPVLATIARLSYMVNGHIGRDWHSGRPFVISDKGDEFTALRDAVAALQSLLARLEAAERERLSDEEIRDFWQEVIGGGPYTPVVLKSARHIHPGQVKPVFEAHAGTAVADVIAGLIFAMNVAANRSQFMGDHMLSVSARAEAAEKREAALRVERDEALALVEVMRIALEPFAKEPKEYRSDWRFADENELVDGSRFELTYEDFFRAEAAFSDTPSVALVDLTERIRRETIIECRDAAILWGSISNGANHKSAAVGIATAIEALSKPGER